MREQLVRLINLLENHIETVAAHPRDPSPLPNQQVPRQFISTLSHLPRGTYRPNLRQPMPTTPSAFMTTSKPVDQLNGSRGKTSGEKTGKDNTQWDPIPIMYTKLVPKLIDSGFIESVYLAPLERPFPRWYDTDARCDYHVGILGHSTKKLQCSQIQSSRFDQAWKLKFEESNGQVGVVDLFEAKAEVIRQEEKAPKEVGSRKATISRDEVSITKDKRGEASGSLTTEWSKERLCKSNKEEEKKMLQHMIQELKLMLKKQKQYSATLREEYNRQTPGHGQTSKNDDA